MMKTMAKENIRFTKINAPYNFVPLNDTVVIPDWGDKISQDLPFSDGEDGSIEVTVENLTPLITVDGRSQTDSKESKEVLESAHVKIDNDKKLYYLPGSGLKGMLRSVVEIMSFGKMQQYDDDFFGYRDFGTGNKYTPKMSAVKCGWLSINSATDEYIVEVCANYDKISHDELKGKLGLSGERWKEFNEMDAFKKAEELEKICGEEYPRISGGILVCTGYMSNKKHEYIFDEQIVGEPLRLKDDDEVTKAFFSVYKPSKNYGDTKDAKRYGGEIKKRLREGKKVPVFFTMGKGKIQTMGITRMYRYPYKYSVSQLVGDAHLQAKTSLDMAECIFGCINQNGHDKALRGRVQVGNAFMSHPIGDSELCEPVKGVLGQPQASYYPLYLDQRGRVSYSTYDTDGARIAGRKRYRVHASLEKEQPQGNDNVNTLTQFRPLKAGQKFSFKIRVHNLRPVEIGALLSALTFHESKTAHHNFGLAKSFGYGKLQLDAVSLHGLTKTKKEYMQEFEAYMNEFVGDWVGSQQIQQLISIASDHSAGIKMMNLEEYGHFKENNLKDKSRNHFSQLEEEKKECNSLLDDEFLNKKQREKKELIEVQKAEIRRKISNNDFDAARCQIENCKNIYVSVGGWSDLEAEWTDQVKTYYSNEMVRLISDGKFDEGQELLDDGKRQHSEVGCWARLQLILTKAKTVEPRPANTDEELTFKDYKYSSWGAFKGKIEKVRKVRTLKPEEKDSIRTFVDSNRESCKKLKKDLANPKNKEWLENVLNS